MNDNLKWYLDFIAEELEKLHEGGFTGNIEFRVNWREGAIANCNLGLNKSIKRIVKPE